MAKELKCKELIQQMINTAFKLDKLGYELRIHEPEHYKIKYYFATAIKLREAADSLEYALN